MVFVKKNLCTFQRWTLGEKELVCWPKVFGRVVKSRILPIHRIIFEEEVFKWKKNSFSSLHVEREFLGSSSGKYWQRCQNGLLRIHRIFLRKLVSLKRFFLLSIDDNEQKIVCLLPKNWLKLTKQRSSCPRESFANFFLQRKFTLFKYSMTLSSKNWILAKIFRHGCQNYFLHVRKDLFKIVLFFKKSWTHFLWHWLKRFVLLAKRFRKSYQNFILTLRWIIPTKNTVLSGKKILSSLADVESELFNFFSKFCLRVVKTALYLCGGYFTGNCLHGKVSFFFSSFRNCAKFCRHFVEKNSIRLPKLRSTFPEGSNEINIIFLFENSFLSTSWHWLKRHQLSGAKFSERCQNCILRVYRIFLGKQLLVNLFFISGPSAKNYKTFGKQFSTVLSELHFSCP